MNKIILPIDTKSLYLNILNDNSSGHTATVATPLKQGNSYNDELGRLLSIREKEVDFENKAGLVNELLKNSKSKNIIRHVYVFDKISVNGIDIITNYQYCIFIKEEVDPSKAQFGRLKVHYPTSLKYEDFEVNINNKEVIKEISRTLKDYAFIVKSFEYDVNTKTLNFNALIVGENKIPYSKVFINEKGVGNKFNLIFNEMSEDYDMEIIALKDYYGDIINTNNFNKYVSKNKEIATELVVKELKSRGAKNIENIISSYPYSLFDLRYENSQGLVCYALITCTATKVKYFNLSIKRNLFCHDFSDLCNVYLISNILDKPEISKYTTEKMDLLSKTINSIKFTDEGE